MSKEKSKIIYRIFRYILVVLLIIIGMCFIFIPKLSEWSYTIQENKKIESFLESQNTDKSSIQNETEKSLPNTNIDESKSKIIAVLEIPKINLKKGLYSKNDVMNSIEYGIEILNESDHPNKEFGNVILASHSGTSNISYFKNLDKLKIGDEINLYFDSIKKLYEVVNIYEVEKSGTVNVTRNLNKNVLTLITCKRGTNKQIVVICEKKEAKI